jgi:hypothetical protein
VCGSTEAADFGWMGYSMRIDHTDGCSYRFTMIVATVERQRAGANLE